MLFFIGILLCFLFLQLLCWFLRCCFLLWNNFLSHFCFWFHRLFGWFVDGRVIFFFILIFLCKCIHDGSTRWESRIIVFSFFTVDCWIGHNIGIIKIIFLNRQLNHRIIIIHIHLNKSLEHFLILTIISIRFHELCISILYFRINHDHFIVLWRLRFAMLFLLIKHI